MCVCVRVCRDRYRDRDGQIDRQADRQTDRDRETVGLFIFCNESIALLLYHFLAWLTCAGLQYILGE